MTDFSALTVLREYVPCTATTRCRLSIAIVSAVACPIGDNDWITSALYDISSHLGFIHAILTAYNGSVGCFGPDHLLLFLERLLQVLRAHYERLDCRMRRREVINVRIVR